MVINERIHLVSAPLAPVNQFSSLPASGFLSEPATPCQSASASHWLAAKPAGQNPAAAQLRAGSCCPALGQTQHLLGDLADSQGSLCTTEDAVDSGQRALLSAAALGQCPRSRTCSE